MWKRPKTSLAIHTDKLVRMAVAALNGQSPTKTQKHHKGLAGLGPAKICETRLRDSSKSEIYSQVTMLGIPPCHTLQIKESKLAQSKIQSQSIVSLSQKDKDYTCQSSIKFLLQQSQATVLQAVDCKEYREANDASHLCACDLHGCWFAWLFPSSPNLVGEGEKWTRRCWRWYPPGGSCREVRQFTSASGLDWLGHKLPWEFEHLSSFTSSLRTRSYLSSGPTMHDLPPRLHS